jgi:flagellar basal body P-ring formation protein FlgA
MRRLRAIVAGLSAAALSAAASVAAAGIRELPVPAVTNSIIPDSAVSARQFHTSPASLAGIALSREQIVGKQARRRLVAGKPIPLSALGEPLSVKRGQVVTAIYSEDGIAISALAVALQDGSEGELITARNPASGVIVEGVVKKDGSLQVGPD